MSKVVNSSVTEKELIEGWEKIGIKKGDIVFVHSSLSSFGYVEGGAITVIESLKKIISEKGILAMPSFPAFIGGEYGIAKNEIVFDVRISPTSMGKIPDTFWRLEDVKRSLHPTHSIAVWGKEKDWLIKDHERCICSCGKDTPFYKMCQEKNSKILLIGVTHSSNTTLHTIEDCNGAPTRSVEIFYPKVIDYKGSIITVPIHPHLPGLMRRYNIMDRICKENKIQNEIMIGNALCKLIDAYKLYKIGSELIQKDPLFLIDKEYYATL
jgi:aminoglycoside 3-N-acetyltransferase